MLPLHVGNADDANDNSVVVKIIAGVAAMAVAGFILSKYSHSGKKTEV